MPRMCWWPELRPRPRWGSSRRSQHPRRLRRLHRFSLVSSVYPPIFLAIHRWEQGRQLANALLPSGVFNKGICMRTVHLWDHLWLSSSSHQAWWTELGDAGGQVPRWWGWQELSAEHRSDHSRPWSPTDHRWERRRLRTDLDGRRT